MSLYLIVAILIFIVCLLLVLVVLVQNSKGGGLASNFSSSNQYMGVRKTGDFLEKTTWSLAIALLILSLVSVFAIPSNNEETKTLDTELRNQMNEKTPQNYTPAPTPESGDQAGQGDQGEQ